MIGRWLRVAAVMAVFAFVAGCSNTSHVGSAPASSRVLSSSDSTAAPTTSAAAAPAATEATTLPWTVPASGGSLAVSSSITLVVPAGAVTAGASVVTSVGSPGTAALEGMDPVAAPVQIEVVNGQLASPVTLQFKVPAPTVPGDVPVIANWDGTAWQPQLSSFDASTSTLSLLTDHLSWWQPWTWHLGTVVKNTFNTFFGDVDTSAPGCDAPNLAGGYQAVLTNKGDAFDGCVTNDGDGLDIRIKNRRRGAFSIELAPGWTGQVVNAINLSTSITQEIFNSTGRTFVIVPGGETAELHGQLNPGKWVSMPVEQDLFSWSIDTLLFAGQVFAAASGASGATDSLSTVVRDANEQVGTLRNALDCLSGNAKWTSAARAQPDSPDAANDLVPTIWTCAKALAKGGATKIIAIIVDLALTPFRLVYQLGEMAVDMAQRHDRRRLDIIRTAAPAPAPATTTTKTAPLTCLTGTLSGTIPPDIIARFTDTPVSIDNVVCAGRWILVSYRPAGIDGVRKALISLDTGDSTGIGYDDNARCITEFVTDPVAAAFLAAGYDDLGPCQLRSNPIPTAPSMGPARCISVSYMYVGMKGLSPRNSTSPVYVDWTGLRHFRCRRIPRPKHTPSGGQRVPGRFSGLVARD